MAERVYHYAIWIRLWHIINTLLFLTLIITGFSMQYTTPENPLIPFQLSTTLHKVTGIAVTFNYLFFLLGNYVTDNGKHYKIEFKGVIGPVMKQLNYYVIGIFKGQPHPFPVNRQRKFNPLQKTTYIFAMYFGFPVLAISGLLLAFPVIFDLVGINNLIIADVFHVLAGIVMTMFVLIHVYFCTIGHTLTSNFKSMITGFHDVEE